MTTAFLSLGSNLGDRRAHLVSARRELAAARGIRLIAASPIYETEPVGGPPDQPWYLNGVLQLETDLRPADLLHRCLRLEQSAGRERKERWGARTLDLDLLLYGKEVIRQAGLQLPHPRLHERAFVLRPLVALAPDLRHPLLGLTMRQLLAVAPANGAVKRLPSAW